MQNARLLDEVRQRAALGRGHLMWGNDYPHDEGTLPFSREALRALFADVPTDELREILGTNAAELYGFDLEFLTPFAAQIGPTVEEIHTPLTAYPEGSTLDLFRGDLVGG